MEKPSKLPIKCTQRRPFRNKTITKLLENKDELKILESSWRKMPHSPRRALTWRQRISHPRDSREAGSKWPIFQILREKDCQPQILYLVKLSFRSKWETCCLSNDRMPKEFAVWTAEASFPSRSLMVKESWSIKKKKERKKKRNSRKRTSTISEQYLWIS